jgi:hypothetical protein
MDYIELNITDATVNATDYNNTDANGTASIHLESFGETVGSLGLTSIIVISAACVLAFAAGCYCALKRTKRKASKIVSIRSIASNSSQASLMSNPSKPLHYGGSPAGGRYTMLHSSSNHHTTNPARYDRNVYPENTGAATSEQQHTTQMYTNPIYGGAAAVPENYQIETTETSQDTCISQQQGGGSGNERVEIVVNRSRTFGKSYSCSSIRK